MDSDVLFALLKPRVLALVLSKSGSRLRSLQADARALPAALFPISTTVIFLTGIYVCGRLAWNCFRMLLQLTVWRGTSVSP